MSLGQKMLFTRDAEFTRDLEQDEILYAIAVSVATSMGRLGDRELLLSSSPSEIYRIICSDGTPTIQPYLFTVYPSDPIKAAERIRDRARNAGIRILTCWDLSYPAILREIPRPPIVVYLKGDIPAAPAVAIVGTRRSDLRSSDHARRIAADCVSKGFTVVSGMAVGIDRAAHDAALAAGGRTVGVLANGIDVVYPRANRDLYRKIDASPGSGLVSEYPPGSFAGRWTFVRRNRIISGLAKATVVVKAGEKSGALITAHHALEQNREVFACPGPPFDEGYAGCHRLIQRGACLLSTTDDLFNEIIPDRVCGSNGVSRESDLPGNCLTSLGKRVLDILASGESDIDQLVRQSGMCAPEVHEALVELELAGLIFRRGTYVARK